MQSLEQQQELLDNVFGSLKKGGLFFIEVRSVNDDIFGKGNEIARNTYIYDGHFRRFIVLDDLIQELKEAGFSIVRSEEKIGFAPYKDTDPMIIRIIAQKD